MTLSVDVLHAIRRACERVGVRYFVVGATAAISYGLARTTNDVDVNVALGDRDPHVLLAALQAEGFVVKVTDHGADVWFQKPGPDGYEGQPQVKVWHCLNGH